MTEYETLKSVFQYIPIEVFRSRLLSIKEKETDKRILNEIDQFFLPETEVKWKMMNKIFTNRI